MARRSLNRDRYDSRIALHPEQKAALLVASPYRKHKKLAIALAKIGETIHKNLAEPKQENLSEVAQ